MLAARNNPHFRRRGQGGGAWWETDAALRAWWPFATAGDFGDYSGNGLHCSAVGDATVGGAPVALQLDGTGDYAQAANDALLQIAGDLCISAWMRNARTQRACLLTKDVRHEFDIVIETDGDVSFYQGNVATFNTGRWNVNTAANTWTHLALVRNTAGKVNTLYVNGVAQTSISWTLAVAVGTNTVAVGARRGDSYFPGQIGNMMLFARQFTAGEVAEVFAGQRAYYGV